MSLKLDPNDIQTTEQSANSIAEPVVDGLSEREKEVLFLAGDGLTDKEIANRLQIGPKTVRTYWDRMRAKLNAASRTEVLAKALRAAYDDLARTEQRLRMFVENMPVIFSAYEEATDNVIVNDEFARVSGYDKEELLRDQEIFAQTIPDPEVRALILSRFRDRSTDYRDLETDFLCKDGTVRSIAWSSRAQENPIPGWASWSIGVDVTARNKAQEALQNSEAALRRLLETSEQGVWIIDRDQETTFVNEKLAEMFGVAVEDLMGGPSYLAEGDSAELVREMLTSGGGRVTFTQKFKKRDGSDLWASVSVNPMYSEQGDVAGYSAVLTDITQRKRTEQSLQLSRQSYGNLLNHTSDQVMRFNKDLACVYANFELTNAKPGESPILEGRNWEEVRKILQPEEEWCSAIRHVFDSGQRMWLDSCVVGSSSQAKKCAVLLPEPSIHGPGHVLAVITPIVSPERA